MLVARDKEGRPKTYGGDFFRARLVSSAGSPQASSAGNVTDHINGTYTVQFPLYWAGGVTIKIQLVHPSEAVNVLERVREVPNKRVFHCSFVDAKTKATNTTQCFSSANSSLLLQSPQQCDFSKPEVNGTWICEKPDKLPCSAISKCRWDSGKSRAKMLELLSEEEKKLFQKPYLEEELEVDPKEPIHVLKAELPTPQHLPACTWDKSAALGHWSGKVWTSSVCNVRVFTQNDIRRCLANRTVYMQGDSTIRQWGQRLVTVVPLNHNKTKGYLARLEGDNSQWNISVRYRFHHFPVQGGAWCVFFDFRYVVETLDSILGGPNTIIVLSLWAHFTAEPLELLRSRLYAIRASIHRLKRRAPGTRVFVRTGTTREHKGGKLEFYLLGSDWLAYQITEVIREMFRADPDVVVLDTWDMSVCQPGKDNVHPDQTMVDTYTVQQRTVVTPYQHTNDDIYRQTVGCYSSSDICCSDGVHNGFMVRDQDAPKPIVKLYFGPPVNSCVLDGPVHFDQATYPQYTQVVVLNRDRLYHQGDVLTVMVVARDKNRRKKTYGGDFFRARLVSSDRSPQASSAGHVTDHRNGIYTVRFPLHWAGNVSIKIQLVHPSEAVKVLQRVREVPNKRCDFSKPEVNGTWICEKPDKLPCSAISKCKYNLDKCRAKMLKLVSEEEKKLFQKPYLEEELEVDPKEPIHVLEAEVPTPQHLPACTWDKSAALGHWSGKVWTSSVCNVRVFTQNDIRRCLANKTVYMQGDSTIRQWGQRLLTVVPLNHKKTNIGPNTIIVLSLWAHFTAEPLELLRSRLYAIRAAIHRLKRRAPGTRVFVRTGTTREHKGGKLEFYLLGSDWLAYQITEVIREMFRADPDVVVLDTWDMSVCQPGKDNVHPDQTMVDMMTSTGRRWGATLVVITAALIVAITVSYQGFMIRDQDAPKPIFKLHFGPPGNSCVFDGPVHFDQATYPQYTQVVVLNRDRLYHQGDVLTVVVVARDKNRRKKTYGGDFFRARLVSSDRSPQASSAGHVTDHCNGIYTVQFPLHWAGGVSTKIQLVHPSETVKVLQRCDFSKPEVNGTWICEKPDKLPCSAISKCKYDLDKCRAKMVKLVLEEEKKLFQKPYLEEELEVDPKEPIHVLKTELPTPQHLPACTWDKSAALGHWSGKVWTSSVCNVRVFTQNDIRRCLANKTVYMQGDSTIRQWGLRLLTVVPLNHHSSMAYTARLEGDNSQWNISVRYRFHHFPVQGSAWCVFYDFRYVVETLDTILGGPNTVIVLSLWAHFTSEPLELLRSRLYAIRASIHRLKRRAPGTRVFVRTGTTREHKGGKLEFYLLGSDWLAYQITEVIREMFRADPDVVVLDTWDMSVCQPGKDNVHPDQTMVDSQLNMLLSHICPD
ncbi:Neurexophilin [Branchiostoma belcheri]|nr:Neurexophilin [Branchiostoma belcheri]